jgi:hypothetical protein
MNEELLRGLAELEIKFGFRYLLEETPACVKPHFEAALEHFTYAPELEYKFNIFGEAGDLLYQVTKLVANFTNAIDRERLTEYEVFFKNVSHELNGRPLLLNSAWGTAGSYINNLFEFENRLGLIGFERVEELARNFVKNQFVATISRRLRDEREDVLYNDPNFLKLRKIPEETAELVDALTEFPNKGLTRDTLSQLKYALDQSGHLVYLVQQNLDSHFCVKDLTAHVSSLIQQYVHPHLNATAALSNTLERTRCRYEASFMRVPRDQMARVCDPVEYVLLSEIVRGETQ